MEDSNTKYENSHACEGSSELNGSNASYRGAKMVSDPAIIVKRRIRGALVPTGKKQ
jgi:hypothetical protein